MVAIWRGVIGREHCSNILSGIFFITVTSDKGTYDVSTSVGESSRSAGQGAEGSSQSGTDTTSILHGAGDSREEAQRHPDVAEHVSFIYIFGQDASGSGKYSPRDS